MGGEGGTKAMKRDTIQQVPTVPGDLSLLLSHTEKKQKNYFASSDPHQWEEEGHGILEGSWGFGCRGIGGWGEEEEEDEERRADNQQSWISG